MPPIRLHLIDGDQLSKAGLQAILANTSDIELEAIHECPSTALESIREAAPDIVLVETSLRSDIDVFAVTREIAQSNPATKVVIFSTEHSIEKMHRAHATGAVAYLSKYSASIELPSTLRLIHAGYSIYTRPTDDEIFPPRSAEPPHGAVVLKDLSERDEKLLGAVAQGATNAQIARYLHVSEGTVKTQLTRFMDQLGLMNRVQLAVLAAQSGLDHEALDLAPTS